MVIIEKGFYSSYTQKIMLKVLLPLVAVVAVFVGLIAVEPPPTQEQLDKKHKREMLKHFQSEHKQILEQLDKLEREEKQLRFSIGRIEEARAKHAALKGPLGRTLDEFKSLSRTMNNSRATP